MQHGQPVVTRRGFLQGLGAIGGAGAVYHGLTTLGLMRIPDAHAGTCGVPDISNWGEGKSAIVLGAGLAGLSSAYLLANSGFQVRVIEANKRYGGRSFTMRQGDKFHEVDGPEQECRFTDKELYFNAGPGRIPQHHCVVLDYCRHLGVKLEPYIFLSESNRLQNDDFMGGKPVPFRQVRFNLRGHISEMLAKVTQQGELDKELGMIDREKFLAMLQNFGSLTREADGAFTYKIPQTPKDGYANSGYRIEPGANGQSGEPYPGISLQDIIASGFWDTELFNHLYYFWQTSLMQPTGGMDMIWHGFLKQAVPPGSLPADVPAEQKGPRPTVKSLVTLNSPVRAVRNMAYGVEVLHGHGDDIQRHTADFCISTLAPIQLVQLGRDFPAPYVTTLADIAYTPACKVGWEARRRFWEIDDAMYGGISWTKDIISQIWYPSSGYQSKTGVLTAVYNNGNAAATFGNYSLARRFEVALEGGEKLHPNNYKQHIMLDTALGIAWQHMPYFIGGWPHETFETRPEAYERLLGVNPEGQIYLAGDFFSYWPGWQEGALAATNWVYEKLRDRVTKA